MARIALIALGLAVTGCARPTAPIPEPQPVASQARAAEALQAVLEGERGRFDEAVALLHARREVSESAKSLARLLNLPLSEGDFRYAWLQHALYSALMDEAADSERDTWIARGFFLASKAAEQYRRGHRVRALGTLRTLERELGDAVERTDDVDLHAMLGNYAHQAGGLIPLRRDHRFDLAREHLEQVVLRFEELSPDAQGVTTGVPGVHAVFAMWWAELLRRDGDPRAQEAYAAVGRIVEGSEETPALRTLAEVAARPSGDEGPLWPSGYDSCIACHSRTSRPRRP